MPKKKEAKTLQDAVDELKEQVLHQESVNSLVTEETEKQTKVIEENQRKIVEMEALVKSANPCGKPREGSCGDGESDGKGEERERGQGLRDFKGLGRNSEKSPACENPEGAD